MLFIGVDFSTNAVPETGLTPTIIIQDVSDSSVVINGAAMSEVGNGGYGYDFDNDVAKNYRAIIDGGSDALDSRYATAWVNGTIDRILEATEIKRCIITDASPTTLAFTTDLTETNNQFWKRGVILITSGNNEGQIRAILSYNGSTKQVTLKTPLDVAPAQNDTFTILTERKYLTPDIEDIIDTMWDDVMEGTLTARQVQRLLLAFIGGQTTGGGSSTVEFKNQAGGTSRITMTVDTSGNRSATVLDAT